MNREQCLDEAKRNTTGQRQIDYGTPEDNFGVIAKLWTAYDGRVIFTALDVAMMLALLKVARTKGNLAHYDNYVDLAGYAACAAEIATSINIMKISENNNESFSDVSLKMAKIFHEES